MPKSYRSMYPNPSCCWREAPPDPDWMCPKCQRAYTRNQRKVSTMNELSNHSLPLPDGLAQNAMCMRTLTDSGNCGCSICRDEQDRNERVLDERIQKKRRRGRQESIDVHNAYGGGSFLGLPGGAAMNLGAGTPTGRWPDDEDEPTHNELSLGDDYVLPLPAHDYTANADTGSSNRDRKRGNRRVVNCDGGLKSAALPLPIPHDIYGSGAEDD